MRAEATQTQGRARRRLGSTHRQWLTPPACLAATLPRGGEGWIFKGGVTVDYHAFPMNVPWGGNASNPTYMGVDPNWYSGSAWARPIFNGGGAAGYHIDSRGFITDVEHQANYVIFDSLEFTGAYWNSDCGGAGVMYSCSYISTSSYTGSTNWEAKNIYAHGWSHGSSASDPATTSDSSKWGKSQSSVGQQFSRLSD